MRKLAFIATLVLGIPTFAGDLNPPPGPALPSMKTLEEVEPRILINDVNTEGDDEYVFRITRSGSYYLASNLLVPADMSGIEITADRVTVDLNGFTIEPVLPNNFNKYGIEAGLDSTEVTVINGFVNYFDFSGIVLRNRAHARDLTVRFNNGSGITLGAESVMANCRAVQTIDTGLVIGSRSIVAGCVATMNGRGIALGTSCVVSNCVAEENVREGFRAGGFSNLTACISRDNGNEGFTLFGNSAVFNQCQAIENGRDGFEADSSVFIECESSFNEDNGFRTIRGRIERCRSTANGIGLQLGDDSIAFDNTVVGSRVHGIEAAQRCNIQRNDVAGSNGHGIYALAACAIVENRCTSNCVSEAFASIRVVGDRGRVDSNEVTDSPGGYGIFVLGKDNLVVRNTAARNDAGDFLVEDGNSVSQIRTNLLRVGPWDNLIH